MKRFSLSITLILAWMGAISQIGGGATYRFLDLATHTRIAALGGKVASLEEGDLGASFANPSLLYSSLNNHLALSYVSYFDDIRYGFVSYARSLGSYGNVGVAFQHVSHGLFTAADDAGNITGTFSGYDMSLSLQYSYAIDSLFTFGVALKPIYSHLEQYQSFGLATDFGVSFRAPHQLFSASVLMRNLGTMLKPYTRGTYESLPFEVMAGISQKLKHAPFRLVLTLQQIQSSELYYRRQKATSSLFLDSDSKKPSTFENYGSELLSHLILGVEFVPVKGFYLRGGYNLQRSNEMKILEATSMAGFSWGIGLKIGKYEIAYSRATYHVAGASNHFSIGTQLDNLFTSHKF